LNYANRPCILAGQGALGAGTELEMLAEKLGAPIIKALLGKAVVPDDSPFTTGGLGLLGTKPSERAMADCDALLIVGSSFPYLSFYPKHDRARGIQIDLDPTRIGLRFPVEVGLVGDARATVQALLPLVRTHQDRSFLQSAQRGMQDWWKIMDARGTWDVVPMHPQVVAHALSEVATDDAIVSTDSGTITTWIARQFKIRRGQMFSLAGNLATMACGLPYAIAAKLAYPDRQSIAFVGDGAFTMLMGEFATAVKYNAPILCVVIKNNVLGQIMWEQLVFLGNPQYGVDLWPIDFAAYARACGGVGYCVDHPKAQGRQGRLAGGDCLGQAGCGRVRGQPVRAANAGRGDPGAGVAHGRSHGPRRAEPHPHRRNDLPRSDPRANQGLEMRPKSLGRPSDLV
jgi:pyruvate dehydrogenase (quinone)/pyruvate oxidase